MCLLSQSGCFLPTPYTGMKALRAGLITDTYFSVHHVHHHNTHDDITMPSQKVEKEVKKLARRSDVYQRLAESLAPEIYGHIDVKKALLLQLVGEGEMIGSFVGGVTRVTDDGMKIRGDINVLLMGDPGVAKSQLLKYISTVAHRGVYTTVDVFAFFYVGKGVVKCRINRGSDARP